MRAWEAIGQLLSEGRSWSGRERNCCFLNLGDGRFANVASVTGLDVPEDSRAVAVTDWDGDGDLDVWMANRTQPRIQFWHNPGLADAASLTLQLVGTRSNRDAIGARVEVMFSDESIDARPLVREVKAGDGFLSQSSKRLHFGLGGYSGPVTCQVRWPNGEMEQVELADPRGAFRWEQGKGEAVRLPRRSVDWESLTRLRTARQASEQVTEPARAVDESLRLIPHAPLPLPELPWLAADDWQTAVNLTAGRPTLVMLWASWCPPCLSELAEWHERMAAWQPSGLQVLALSVEPAEPRDAWQEEPAKHWFRMDEEPFRVGWAAPPTLDRLDLLQRTLVSLQEPLGLPTSFLVDAQGRLRAIYRGPVAVEQVLADVQRLENVTTLAELRAQAVPFPGRWLLQPLPPDLLAIPQRLRGLGDADAALDYLQRHVGTPAKRPSTLANEWFELFATAAAQSYFATGIELARQGDRQRAEEAWRAALEVQPDNPDALLALSSLYGQQRRYAEALGVFQRMRALRPEDPIVANNVAWLLATAPQEELRQPQQAVAIAEAMVARTQRRVASALDTLAASYAAVGRYDDAVRTLDEAISLAASQSSPQVRRAMEARAELYRQAQPYREPLPERDPN